MGANFLKKPTFLYFNKCQGQDYCPVLMDVQIPEQVKWADQPWGRCWLLSAGAWINSHFRKCNKQNFTKSPYEVTFIEAAPFGNIIKVETGVPY